MNKLDAMIDFTATYRVKFTPEQVDLFRKVAEAHYDAVCRAACNRADLSQGRKNGFLTMWRDQLHFALMHTADDADAFWLHATNRDLQTLCKILEPINLEGTCTAAEKAECGEIFRQIFVVFHVGNQRHPESIKVAQ